MTKSNIYFALRWSLAPVNMCIPPLHTVAIFRWRNTPKAAMLFLKLMIILWKLHPLMLTVEYQCNCNGAHSCVTRKKVPSSQIYDYFHFFFCIRKIFLPPFKYRIHYCGRNRNCDPVVSTVSLNVWSIMIAF